MKKQEKVKIITETLQQLYPNPPVPLGHSDPYTLLVAVLLSAQCTDKRVNAISPLLFKEADSPQKMANLTVNQIKNIIKPCGLSSSKSKAIHNLSRKILDDFGGRVPCTFKELESLPGIGHKSASVVMMQAFGKPAFPVDTHIHRLAYRWGLSNGKNVKQTENDLKRLFPQKLWACLHLQMIYFGRQYCPARGHRPDTCPLCSIVGMKLRKNR